MSMKLLLLLFNSTHLSAQMRPLVHLRRNRRRRPTPHVPIGNRACQNTKQKAYHTRETKKSEARFGVTIVYHRDGSKKAPMWAGNSLLWILANTATLGEC